MSRCPRARPGLAVRRQELLLRSAQLRERLAQHAQVFRPALRAADKVRDGARWARRNPIWVVMGATALAGMAVMRPRAALRLAGRAWSGWQLFNRVRPVVTVLLRRLT